VGVVLLEDRSAGAPKRSLRASRAGGLTVSIPNALRTPDRIRVGPGFGDEEGRGRPWRQSRFRRSAVPSPDGAGALQIVPEGEPRGPGIDGLRLPHSAASDTRRYARRLSALPANAAYRSGKQPTRTPATVPVGRAAPISASARQRSSAHWSQSINSIPCAAATRPSDGAPRAGAVPP
jgi:hypothetical protein